MLTPLKINKDIKQAETITTDFYTNLQYYEQAKDDIFAQTWQIINPTHETLENGEAAPFYLLEACLNEPLLLSKDKTGQLHCMSNVCTHRGNILLQEKAKLTTIRCGYHGKCFHLNGQFKSMPEFEEAENFPSVADHLPKTPLEKWGSFLFTSLNPKVSFQQFIQPIQERLHWFPFDKLTFHPKHSKDYYIHAHWALYCDNYLEGFHVPFVHEHLNNALDYSNYTTEIFDYCNLQLGIAKDKEVRIFDLPSSSPDYGKNIYAYYYFLFPNMMFNVYPWGLSLNIVYPMGIDSTKISFYTYLLEGHSIEEFKKSPLHETEMEDEAVVQQVQKGVESRLYKKGRFSPKQEKGVHHFHSLIANWMNA